ncbi:traB domain-containing protein [Diaphorina citri]|uniref:TraB domain-containing protein n=1 Tax=Diaphorina citri TaxID=121845 RepID=A0A1S3DFI8_DIACI|nr:traB domain-containing protein [Diaphorina citri]
MKAQDDPAPDPNPWYPDTVSVLRNEHTGAEIYLVGTAHFSRQSQDDVSLVIQRVRPNIVLVELCRSRAAVLSMDEEAIEREAKNISYDKMKATIAENGLVQGLMYLLFLNMSAQLTKKLGMAPGGEFRRALSEVGYTDLGKVFVHERDLHLTWSLQYISQLKTAHNTVVVNEFEIDPGYTDLGKVFVHERDLYLTWSLQYISQLKTVHNTVVVNEFEIDPELLLNYFKAHSSTPI